MTRLEATFVIAASGSPLRTIDVLGVLAFQTIALLAIFHFRGVGAVLGSLSVPRPANTEDKRAAARLIRGFWQLGTLFMASFLLISGSLLHLELAADRPGPVPGGIWTKGSAVAFLIAWALIIGLRVLPRLRAQLRQKPSSTTQLLDNTGDEH